MLTSDIVKQLQENLPRLTGLFSDQVTLSSLTSTGLLATATTATPHGFSTSNNVFIKDAVNPIPVISLTQVGNIATAVTSLDHDLTENFQETIMVDGADQPEYNGTFTLLTVPNRRTFTYQISGDPASPATGTIFYLEESIFDYNGQKSITVTSPTEFTYPLTRPLGSPAQGTIIASSNRRIAGAIDLDRAIDSYTKQAPNKLWLFVVLGDVTANKDRHIQSDATASMATGTIFRQRLIETVDLYIVAPGTLSESGRPFRDLMEQISIFIYKSLLGKKFDSPLSEKVWSQLVLTGHGFQEYVKSYYIHRFAFERTVDITFDDTIGVPNTVALRDILLEFKDPNDTDKTILTAEIDLDEDPL